MYYDMQSDTVMESLNESTPSLAFKSIKEFSLWMKKNISYSNFTKLMSPDEVIKKGSGSCHDQVMLEKHIFKKCFSGINTGTIFFIEYNDNESSDAMTHTLLWYKDKGSIYWFENSWGGMEGVHGPYKSLKELKDTIIELHKKIPSYKRYPKIEFSTMKNVSIGMSLGEYVNNCLS